jgi:hypothetical protein
MSDQFTFRCTFCRKTIGRPLTKQDLGVPDDQDFVVGKLYRYERCYCGMGKFVSCELADLTPEEIQERLSRGMAH